MLLKIIWEEYNKIAARESKVIFGGRLAEYRYYDMHQVIGSAIHTFKNKIENYEK